MKSFCKSLLAYNVALMGENPGSDGLPFAWLTQRLDSLERRMVEHNQAIRADMNTGFRDLATRFSSHEDEDQDVATRVTVIETERDIEKSVAGRRGALAGSIAAGLVLTAVEALKKAFSHP